MSWNCPTSKGETSSWIFPPPATTGWGWSSGKLLAIIFWLLQGPFMKQNPRGVCCFSSLLQFQFVLGRFSKSHENKTTSKWYFKIGIKQSFSIIKGHQRSTVSVRNPPPWPGHKIPGSSPHRPWASSPRSCPGRSPADSSLPRPSWRHWPSSFWACPSPNQLEPQQQKHQQTNKQTDKQTDRQTKKQRNNSNSDSNCVEKNVF